MLLCIPLELYTAATVVVVLDKPVPEVAKLRYFEERLLDSLGTRFVGGLGTPGTGVLVATV